MTTAPQHPVVEVHHKTVEDHIRRVDFMANDDVLRVADAINRKIIARMAPEDQATAKEILASENELAKKVVGRYMRRVAAVTAKDKTPEQKRLMAEYNLVSERPVVTLLTLGFNHVANHNAEVKALRRDASEIAAEMGYAPQASRAWLAKKNLTNLYAV